MARMLGTCRQAWCPYCRAPAGNDCPDTSRSKKAARAREGRAWRREWAGELPRRGGNPMTTLWNAIKTAARRSQAPDADASMCRRCTRSYRRGYGIPHGDCAARLAAAMNDH